MNAADPSKWVDLYADYLFSYALLKTGKRETAEDLVQETFLSAFRGAQQFRGDSTEKTWLTRILKNKIADHFRKKRPEQPLDDYLRETTASFEQSFFTGDGYGTWKEDIGPNFFSEGPDAALMAREFQDFLRLCLMKLPERLRDVFLAKFVEEEDPDSICKDFGISASNYWVILFRAKTLMRKCLENKGAV